MSVAAPLESVPCDLCGRDDAQLLVTKNGFQVVRCRGCSLVYVNPRLKVGGLAALYETDTFFDHQVTRADDESWRPQAEQRLALINRHHPRKGTLLDVGCSAGWFMGVAEADGWKVTGLDVSAGSVAHSKARGYDARVATLDDHGLAPGSFDAITMFDSIEHMPSPLRALRAAHDLLADDGVVMITTPNVDGLFPRLTYQLLCRPFGSWDHPGPPGHIFQFSQETLGAALERTGFALLHDKTEAIPLGHSVGALEEEILDVIKRRGRKPPPVAAALGAPSPLRPVTEPPIPSAGPRLLRQAFRRTVRTAAWALVGGLAGPAPLLGAGDSLVVIARKRGA